MSDDERLARAEAERDEACWRGARLAQWLDDAQREREEALALLREALAGIDDYYAGTLEGRDLMERIEALLARSAAHTDGA